MSNPVINLTGAKRQLNYINQDIQSKCGESYRLQILQFEERNEEDAVYDITKDYDILLCLYHNDKCISSVTGRYNKLNMSMELLSKTKKEYEGLKYNIYLRTIFIYLMFFVRQPLIKTIYSYATNPVSTYAMYKHFHATNPELTEYLEQNDITPESFTLENAKNFHNYYAEKHRQTDETAQEELVAMLLDCSEMKGDECTIEDLGYETEEEAIAFIKSTMNFNAIILELNLENDSEKLKSFLLDKLHNTQIICYENKTSVARGGKFSRRPKSRRPKSRRSKSRRPKSRRPKFSRRHKISNISMFK